MQTSPPPPSPSEVAIFTWKMRAVLLFFYFFESWLIVFTIYGDTLGVPPTKKKVVQKLPNLQLGKMCIDQPIIFLILEVFVRLSVFDFVLKNKKLVQKLPNFQERCVLLWKWFLVTEFFCPTFSFWGMVDFVYNWPYTKSTIA